MGSAIPLESCGDSGKLVIPSRPVRSVASASLVISYASIKSKVPKVLLQRSVIKRSNAVRVIGFVLWICIAVCPKVGAQKPEQTPNQPSGPLSKDVLVQI